MSSTSSTDSDYSNLEDSNIRRNHKVIRRRKLNKRDSNVSKSWKRKKNEMSRNESKSGNSSGSSEEENPTRGNMETDMWMKSGSDYEGVNTRREGNLKPVETSDLENRIPRHDPTIEWSQRRSKNRSSKSDMFIDEGDEEEMGDLGLAKGKTITRRELDPQAWAESDESDVENDKMNNSSNSAKSKFRQDPPQYPPDFVTRYDPTVFKSIEVANGDKATIFSPANYYWKVDEKLRFGEKKEENPFSLVKTFGDPEIKEEIESESDDELPVYVPPSKRKRSTDASFSDQPPVEPDHGSHYQSGSQFLNKMRIPGELQRYQKENKRPGEAFFFKKDDPRFKESKDFFSQFIPDEDFENRRRMAKLQLRQRQKKHFKKSWPSQSRRTKAFKF